MKRILIFFMLFLYGINYSQSPTLGIGLETLTMNKGTIDVEVLTQIIMEKQKELKKEALKRFMFKMFPDTDYTTRYYVQNSLNILLNEKNPQVIEKEILELTTNYAIALGVTKAYLALNKPKIKGQTSLIVQNNWIAFLNEKCGKQKEDNNMGSNKSTPTKEKGNDFHKNDGESAKTVKNDSKSYNPRFDYNKISAEINNLDEKKDRLCTLFNKFKNFNESFDSALIDKNGNRAERKLARRDNKLSKIKKIAYKNNLDIPKNNFNSPTKDTILSFGQNLDLVSLALSKNEKLKKKGFFKNKIDYTEEQPYFISETEDTTRIGKINRKVTLYVDNYEIIGSFINDLSPTVQKQDNIFSHLLDNYGKQINTKSKINQVLQLNSADFINDSNILSNLNSLKSILTEYKSLKKIFDENHTKVSTLSGNTLNDYDDKILLIEQYNDLVKKYLLIGQLDKNNSLFVGEKVNVELKKIDVDVALKNKVEKYRSDLLENKQDSVKLSLLVVPDIKFIDNEIKKINVNGLNLKNIDLSMKSIDKSIDENVKKITESDAFFKGYINYLMNQIETNQFVIDRPNLKSDSNLKIATVIGDLYGKLNDLRKHKTYNYSDVDYIENQILKNLVEAKNLTGGKVTNGSNPDVYLELIDLTKNLAPLLKMKIIIQRELNLRNFRYEKELFSLFEFIGNLDKLDKAETYSSVISLIRENSESITNELPDGAFKDSYKIFINGVKKYTLINPNAEKEYVEVDVISFLSDLQQYYDRNNTSRFSLYLTLGLNQNFFFNKFTFPDSNEEIKNIGFASEKIGIRYKILDFKKYKGYENVIKSDVYLNKKTPFINDWYVALYGSGLLYSLANTSTNRNFTFAHVGLATGLRFYNALDFNVVLGFPFVKNKRFPYGAFYGIGLDIPLGEYLEKLGNK